MAIGGALRAAIKAGNWASAARESRRRARALAELNARGGIGRPGRARGADEYLQGRGVDVNAMTSPGTGNPYADFVTNTYPQRYNQALPYAESPFGGVVVQGPRGRSRYGGEGYDFNFDDIGVGGVANDGMYRGPIQAPYEGVRVWPNDGGLPSMSGFGTGPWMGRGLGPRFDFHSNVGPQGLSMPAPAASSWDVPQAFGGRGSFDDIVNAQRYREMEEWAARQAAEAARLSPMVTWDNPF
jgi:hypothetical protein